MSILIKGMEMPKDGAYWCEIGVAGDIAVITIHGEDRRSFHLVPTVDAVDVVRCKDCANYAGDGMYCAWGLLTGDMGYCHHGYVADRAAATEETGAHGDRKGGDEE